MVRKSEYDFLTWTSLPSSLKHINDETGWIWRYAPGTPAVKPGIPVRVAIQVRQENVASSDFSGDIAIHGWDGEKWVYRNSRSLPLGTFDWGIHEVEATIPENVSAIRVLLRGGSGTPGVTWFDDLKVYQEGVLIYTDDFTSPLVNLAAGLTPVIAVGAVVGANELQKARVIP